jgi:hypothetical protein
MAGKSVVLLDGTGPAVSAVRRCLALPGDQGVHGDCIALASSASGLPQALRGHCELRLSRDAPECSGTGDLPRVCPAVQLQLGGWAGLRRRWNDWSTAVEPGESSGPARATRD